MLLTLPSSAPTTLQRANTQASLQPQLRGRCISSWRCTAPIRLLRQPAYVDTLSGRRGIACAAEGDAAQQSPAAPADSDDVWSRLRLLTRQTQLAAQEEDYALAAQLRNEAKGLTEQLPPVRQYMWGRLQTLRSGGRKEQLAAISALGDAGDASIVPDLAQFLADPTLQDATEAALWAIFHRCPNPSVTELMNQGCRLMMHAPQLKAAKEMFAAITHMDPSFAEGWNKKATVEYVLHEYEESLEDCKRAIELQPFHWGAMAGSVLCLMQLRKLPEALEACRATLAVHPRCDVMHTYQRLIRDQLNGEGGASIGGDFS